MKVLVIQQRHGIGDMVIFLPYLHALAKNLNCSISLLAKNSSKAKELLSDDNHFDEIIELDQSKDGIRGFLKLAKELKAKNYDRIYIFNGSVRYFILSKFLNIKTVYQYPLFISKDIIFQTAKTFTENCIGKTLSTQPKLILDKKKVDNAKNKYSIDKEFKHIVLGVSASGYTKRWGVDNFIKLATELSKIYECKFYIALGPNDKEINEKFLNSPIKNKCISFLKLSIRDVLPIIKNSDLYIGNDTGFLHISSALNIDCIGIYVDSPAFSYSAYSNKIDAVVPKGETIQSTSHDTLGQENISFDEVFDKAKSKLVHKILT
tara:strand:+ start:1501 stop:2460 length:960 start_codon:yes stop_codon:yes gene_type:complete